MNDSKSTYKIIASSKIVNNYEINLNEITFELTDLKNDFLLSLTSISNIDVLQSFPETKIKLSNNSIIDVNTNTIISNEELESNEKLSVQVLVSLIIFNEIKNPDLIKNSDEFLSKAKACDRTIAHIGTTKSGSTAAVTTATNTFILANPDCSTVGGVDSGCIWGDYGCIATQEIHCTGGGCKVKFGKL